MQINPKEYRSCDIHVRLTKREYAKLKRLAKKHDTSKAQIMVSALMAIEEIK